MSLEEIKETIGVANYLSEYMAQPGRGDEVFFPNLEEEKHGYWFDDPDELFDVDPSNSQTMMCWYSGEELKRHTLASVVSSCRLFMAVDTSYTSTKDSDSKVCTLMGVNKDNELFVFDMW